MVRMKYSFVNVDRESFDCFCVARFKVKVQLNVSKDRRDLRVFGHVRLGCDTVG